MTSMKRLVDCVLIITKKKLILTAKNQFIESPFTSNVISQFEGSDVEATVALNAIYLSEAFANQDKAKAIRITSV